MGVMPRSTMAMSSSAWVPCGMAGASEPQAILTPAARALANICRACGKISAAFFCRIGWMRSMAMWSASAVVPTRKVPDFGHQRDGVVAGQRPVLDAVDPGPDAGPDAGVAVGVGRHAQAVAVRLVHDGRQLLVGVLLGARRPS